MGNIDSQLTDKATSQVLLDGVERSFDAEETSQRLSFATNHEDALRASNTDQIQDKSGILPDTEVLFKQALPPFETRTPTPFADRRTTRELALVNADFNNLDTSSVSDLLEPVFSNPNLKVVTPGAEASSKLSNLFEKAINNLASSPPAGAGGASSRMSDLSEAAINKVDVRPSKPGAEARSKISQLFESAFNSLKNRLSKPRNE